MATRMVVEFNHVDALSAKLRARAGEAAHQAAQLTETVIKNGMRESKSGRTYRRGKKLHQASAPGETPAVDYGHLINSIGTVREGIMAAVFTNDEAAEVLELGGRFVQARQFMEPAVNQVKPTYLKMMAEVLK